MASKRRKLWDGKWMNTTKDRRELLIQIDLIIKEMDQLSERAKFLKALMQMAVVALQKSSD